MTNHILIDNIERFLRGQMTLQEEIEFRGLLRSNTEMCKEAYIIASLFKFGDWG